MKRDWTSKEIKYLEKWYEKKGVPHIAKKLNRPCNSIKRKAQYLGLNAYVGEKLYLRTLANCFNCDSRVVNRWIEKYDLPYSKVKRGQTVFKQIEQLAFWKWAKDHQDIIPWSKYEKGTILPEPDWLRECIRNYTYKNNRKPITDTEKYLVISLREKGYSFEEISKQIGRTKNSVIHVWRKR